MRSAQAAGERAKRLFDTGNYAGVDAFTITADEEPGEYGEPTFHARLGLWRGIGEQMSDAKERTFSQREGIEPLPQPLAVGTLSDSARNRLWSQIYKKLKGGMSPNELMLDIGINEPWLTLIHDYYVNSLNKPGDEFSPKLSNVKGWIKPLFLKDKYNEVFDFLEFVLRHDSLPPNDGFYKDVDDILKECLCAYTVVRDGPTIVPIALPEQRESVKEAIRELASGPFEGARSHLRKSANLLNNNDLAGSVRESIHAVESVARRLDSGAKTSLKPALDALSKAVPVHGAFIKGMEKLYGYTSNEDGIRHAHLDDTANVDTHDAVFMFGACASFCAYLVNKSREAGLLTD